MEKKKLVLTFPHDLLDKPITYHLIKDYDLIVNILKAKITPKEEGILVLEVSGKKTSVDQGIVYLKNSGIAVEPLIKDIKWDKDKCTHCTACVSVCPTDAFTVIRETMQVVFDRDKCIACGLCVSLCPYHAMEIIL